MSTIFSILEPFIYDSGITLSYYFVLDSNGINLFEAMPATIGDIDRGIYTAMLIVKTQIDREDPLVGSTYSFVAKVGNNCSYCSVHRVEINYPGTNSKRPQ